MGGGPLPYRLSILPHIRFLRAMPPNYAAHGRVIGRYVDIDSISGKDADFPPPLHSAGGPGPNFETTFDLDDERRVAV